MNWLVKLYPRQWRRRYGAELEELVASQPRSLRLTVDLLAGAIDAHARPQAFEGAGDATTAERGGLNMLTRMNGCGQTATQTATTTRRDAFVGAGLTLGFALVVAAIMVLGSGPVAETIGLTMFPGVLVVGMQPMYLRGHSTLAKVVLIGGPFLVLFLIGLVAGLVQIA